MTVETSTLALVVFALGAAIAAGVFAVSRRKNDDDGAMLSLLEAANTAHDAARRERMAIAFVADQSGDPVGWFAKSIAEVVATYEKSDAGFEQSRGVGTGMHSLYIRKRDYHSYLDWARSMQ